MPLLNQRAANDLLVCIVCAAPLGADAASCSNVSCACAAVPYRSIAQQPILIDGESSIVDPASVTWTEPKRRGVAGAVLGVLARENEVAVRVSARLCRDLATLGRRPRVLIVGGGTIGNGLEGLYRSPELDLVAFDIFPTACTQFVADAHRIPLAAESVDAVVVQAVLEHVLDPWRVVDEIYRVLRPAGLVYADTPFLQPVHEGPYDFTRFTESGHRWLFRRFEAIESGVVAGPGAQFASSLAHVGRSVFPVRGVGPIVRALATPLGRLIDRFAKPRVAIDGASSVYFYGRRTATPLAPRAMIDHYRGAQRIPARRPKPT